MLWLTKRVIFGTTNNSKLKFKDVNKAEIIIVSYLGLFCYSIWSSTQHSSDGNI